MRDFGTIAVVGLGYVGLPLAVELDKEARQEYGINLSAWDALPDNADAIVAVVSHDEYAKRPVGDLLAKLKPHGVFIDIKSAYPQVIIEAAGYKLWRL